MHRRAVRASAPATTRIEGMPTDDDRRHPARHRPCPDHRRDHGRARRGQALDRADRAPARRPRPGHLLHARRGGGQPGHRRRRRARRPLHVGAAPRRRGQRRHRRARSRRHRPARRAAGDGGQVGPVQDLRRARLDPPGARHDGRRRDRRDPRAAASQLRCGEPRGRVGAAVLRARAPADRGSGLPGHARRPARHRDRPARRAARGLRGRGPRPGAAADRDLRSRCGGGGVRAHPAGRRGHGRRRARLPRRAGPGPAPA